MSDRLLESLGADPALVESVLGDLAEEHVARSARDGARAARVWYLLEALRSAPHLAVSGVRRSSIRTRALAVAATSAATVAAIALFALDMRVPPPARLVVDIGTAGGVVVNNTRPVKLPLRVVDAAGRELAGDSVRYRFASAAPLVLSRRGVITCTHRKDATVVASLGVLTTRFLVHCRPVRAIRATIWNDFIVGTPPRELPVDFIGLDGRSERLLSARVAVDDSSVAVMDGLRIRPLAAGRAHVNVRVGNQSTSAAIRVFAEVPSFEGVHAGRRLVAVPLRLIPGGVKRFALPTGSLSLVFLGQAEVGQSDTPLAPSMSVDGPIMCLPALAPRVYRSSCLARAPGATLTIAHPGASVRTVVGHVALELEGR
ncbi:MAG TPA: hypothetical protein VE869_14330 [Gemmatimonas sp.]|nr:hypothetical protein [Gemmatimonas sp.]